MFARNWRAAVAQADGDAYANYIDETGMVERDEFVSHFEVDRYVRP